MKLIVLALVGLLIAQPAIAQYSTGLGGSGIRHRSGTSSFVGKGSKFIEGDSLNVPGEYQLLGDYGAIFITIRKGRIDFAVQRRDMNGCIQNLFVYYGWAAFSPRPLLCPGSRIQVQSGKTGGTYTFRGTRAEIQDDDRGSVLKVFKGQVDTENAGKLVAVPEGYTNRIEYGKPPTQPILLGDFLKISNLKAEKTLNGVWVTGETHPFSQIEVEGTPAKPDYAGHFRAFARFPISGNDIRVRAIDGIYFKDYFLPLESRRF